MPDHEPGHDAAPSEPGGEYSLAESRIVTAAIQGGLLRLCGAAEETPGAAAFVQAVNECTPLIVERLAAREITALPHAVELGRHIAALQNADDDLGGRPNGYIAGPYGGVDREQLRALLAGQFDFVRALGRTHRTGREDAALAMVNVYSAVVEANPDGLWLDKEAAIWLHQIADAFLVAFPDAPGG